MKRDKLARMRRWRQGGYAILLTGLVAVAVVLSVVSLDALDAKYALSADMTQSGMTAISDATRATLASLDEDVSISVVYQAGTRDATRTLLERLLANYRAASARVHVDAVDPIANPAAITRLLGANANVGEGAIIVANADATRARLIDASDLYGYRLDPETYAYEATDFMAEQRVTAAIGYIASESVRRLAFVTGHNEAPDAYMQSWLNRLALSNIETSETTLTDIAPDTADALVAVAPSMDLTDAERDSLLGYMENGGSMFLIVDPALDLTNCPNWAHVLDALALSLGDGAVVEDARASGNYLGATDCLIPNIPSDAPISDTLDAGTRLLMPDCRAVAGADAQALLVSSNLAHDHDATAVVRTLALMRETDAGGRVVVVGSAYAVVDSDYLYASGNLDFAMAAVDTLIGGGTAALVGARALAPATLIVPNAFIQWLLIALTVLVLPGAVAVTGAVVLRKREKS